MDRQYSQHENRFDAISSAGSSAGSIASAASYMSFGPRKGRRAAFQNTVHNGQKSPYTFDPEMEEVLSRRMTDGNTGNKIDQTIPITSEDTYEPPTQGQLYQCTFCRQCFSRFFTWKRHEESAHIAPNTWTCRPSMFQIESNGSGCPVCTFLSSNVDGSPELPCQHRFQECWQKQETERVFYRRDTFKQHLRSVHFKDSEGGNHIKTLCRSREMQERIQPNDAYHLSLLWLLCEQLDRTLSAYTETF